MRTLWPSYLWSHDDKEWADGLANGTPGVAIINPASGPGEAVDDALMARCAELLAHRWLIVGYVASTYFHKPVADYLAELARYPAFGYPIVGAFCDETPSLGGNLAYGRAVHGAARALGRDGAKGLSFFNPGGGDLPLLADRLPGSVWVTYEGPASGYWPAPGSSSKRQAHLVYADDGTADARMARTQVGWGYTTPDTLPNPWSSWKG